MGFVDKARELMVEESSDPLHSRVIQSSFAGDLKELLTGLVSSMTCSQPRMKAKTQTPLPHQQEQDLH